MNARLQMRLLKPASTVIPVPKVPVRLVPIPWGTPDPKTAAAVIRNMVDTTPGLEIPWNLRDAKTRRLLHSHHIPTH